MRQTFVPRTNQHERGWGGRDRTLHVPLVSTGERKRGFFRVPPEFIASEHTNAQHRATQYRNQKVKEWVEWYRRSGWELQGKPLVTDPIVSPTTQAGGDSIDEEGMRVYVEATFIRTAPMKMPLDLFLHKRDEARRYDVALEEALVENPLPQASEHIDAEPGRDSMVEAQERREQLGIRRELIVDDGMMTGAELIYETPRSSDEESGLDRDQE